MSVVDQPFNAYAVIAGTGTLAQTGTARISATGTLAQSGTARIVAGITQTGTARISGDNTLSQSGTARIVGTWSQLCTTGVGYAGHPCALCRDGAGAGADYATITTDPTPLVVSEGQSYLVQGEVNAFGTANGTVSIGMVFYDEDGAEVSSEWESSTGSPATYTLLSLVVTTPANAVTARVKVKAVGHTTGRWCFGYVVVQHTNRHFVLSSLKHYFSKKFDRR